MHCSCIVKALIVENFNELPLTFNASLLYNITVESKQHSIVVIARPVSAVLFS